MAGNPLAMAQPRQHLSHAPIVEAALDIRVNPTPELSLDRLKAALNSLEPRYSAPQSIAVISGGFGLQGGQPIATVQPPQAIGWTAKDEQSGRVVRFAHGQFVFSQLAPYTNWEEMAAEARRLWSSFLDSAAPTEVSRLGLRYINRISLPSGIQLRDWFAAPPDVPAEIPQAVQQFLSRILVYDEVSGISAVITQAMESAPDVLLDIDAYIAGTLKPDAPAVWEAIGRLRQLKNRVFFASLTEAAAEALA